MQNINGIFKKINILVACLFFTLTLHANQRLWVGQSYECDATSSVMGITTNVSWSCNGGYISFSGSGFYRKITVTQFFSGTATITCKWQYKLYSNDTYKSQSRSWTISCYDNPAIISPSYMTLAIGETGYVGCSLTYSNSYSYAADIYYSSSNPSIAKVNPNTGLVEGVSPGTTYITAYSKVSGNSPYCTVTVKKIEPNSATINSPINIDAESSKQLTVSVSPSNAEVSSTQWYSNDADVASISSSGVLTGVTPGTTSVYCIINGKVRSNNATVYVSEPPFNKASVYPENNSTEQTVFTCPSVSYSLALYKGDNFDNISLKSSSGTTVKGKASISGKTITFTPDKALNANTKYTLTIPAKAVKNKWGTHYTSQESVTFTTGDLEKLTLTSSLNERFVNKGDQVALTASKPTASIYYTLDGSTPNTNSTLYANAITVNSEIKLRAIAIGDGYESSDILSMDYYMSNMNVTRIYPDKEELYKYDDVTPFVSFSNDVKACENIMNLSVTRNDSIEISGEIIVADSTIYFSPDKPLDLGCIYTVNVPADAVVSPQGEGNDPISWKFTTGEYITAISSGSSELATAIKTDGSLQAWGMRYESGNSNDGSYSYTSILKPETFITSDVKAVSSGFMHHAVIKKDGSLWMWGRQYCGEFGNNSTLGSANPIKVMDNVVSVSAGGQTTAIIKDDNTLWMCGRNDFGQIGNGTTTTQKEPVQIMENVVSAISGWCSSFAIKDDGTLLSWGRNDKGQLGDGSTQDRWEPSEILNDVAIVTASASGGDIVAAIKNDGSLWTWGANDSIPTEVAGDVSNVAVGSNYIQYVKNDGSLWAYGDNGFGQLGDGGNSASESPIRIMDDVSSIISNGHTTLANKNDGSVWAWGRNYHGTLGDESKPSNTAFNPTPKMIIEGRTSSALNGITSNKKNIIMAKGDMNVIPIFPIPLNADYDHIEWDCDNNNIISVDQNGVIASLSYGKTIVTATIHGVDGTKYATTCNVSVQDLTNVYDITNKILKTWAYNNNLYVAGLSSNQHIKVYGTNGVLIFSGISTEDTMTIPLPYKGVFIVNIDNNTTKVLSR